MSDTFVIVWAVGYIAFFWGCIYALRLHARRNEYDRREVRDFGVYFLVVFALMSVVWPVLLSLLVLYFVGHLIVRFVVLGKEE